jgi:hypothetical protein
MRDIEGRCCAFCGEAPCENVIPVMKAIPSSPVSVGYPVAVAGGGGYKGFTMRTITKINEAKVSSDYISVIDFFMFFWGWNFRAI